MKIHPGCKVYLVDDDASVRDALGLLLGSYGLPVVPFADARSFLQGLRGDWRGCLLADIRMPGMDGLALQRHLQGTGSRLPVIIMTGHGDVESARDAFRARAVDFLEKPIDHERLLRAIDEAFAREASAQDEKAQRAEFTRRLAVLTPREREVMDLVIAGRHNREIAVALNISARTVEVHKARMMDKLMVDNIPELVRLSVGAAGSD